MIASNLLSTTEPAAVRRDQAITAARAAGPWRASRRSTHNCKGVRWASGALQLDGSGIRAIDTTGALQLLNLVAALERTAVECNWSVCTKNTANCWSWCEAPPPPENRRRPRHRGTGWNDWAAGSGITSGVAAIFWPSSAKRRWR